MENAGDNAQGPGDIQGPWNSGERWEKLDNIVESIPLDGGDGMASVTLKGRERQAAEAMAERTMSDPQGDPLTRADLGAGPGAGSTTALDGR